VSADAGAAGNPVAAAGSVSYFAEPLAASALTRR